MRRLLLIATAAAAAIAIPSTAAQACDGVGYQSFGPGTTGTVYVTDDLGWIYVESNDIGGLQRGQGGLFDSTSVYSNPDCDNDEVTADSKLY